MPPNQAKAFVRIYCKIFCDDFPDHGFTKGKVATGDEIYDFLSKPLNYAFDIETDKPIPGDYAIWYLATNEKGGILQVNEQSSEWSFGESNWERVNSFLYILHETEILSDQQYDHLMSITEEGQNAFDSMYDIPLYLKAKHSGKEWIRTNSNAKEDIRKMISSVHDMLISSGWQVIS